MRQHGDLTWEARMKVLLGTAKALAYLHDAIEPKVVHRDIKSSNILIDGDFNARFLILAWPSYLVLEKVTSQLELRESLALGLCFWKRLQDETQWTMVVLPKRRSEEVVDPNIETRPLTRALKRALLTGLRCVDPDSDKRPKMSQVVRMLESEKYPIPREIEGTEELKQIAWRLSPRGRIMTLTRVTIQIPGQRVEGTTKHNQTFPEW